MEAPCHPEPGAGLYSAESQLGRLGMGRGGSETLCSGRKTLLGLNSLLAKCSPE